MAWSGSRRQQWLQDTQYRTAYHETQAAGGLSGENSALDFFPPSQREYPYGLGLPESRHTSRAPGPGAVAETDGGRTRETVTAAAAAAVQPSRASRSSRSTDSLKERKRKFLEMDDWTGAKLRRPLDITFAPPAEDAPVWG